MCFKGKSPKTPQNSGWGIAVIYQDYWWIASFWIACTSIFLQSTWGDLPDDNGEELQGDGTTGLWGFQECAKWMECVLHWLILTHLFHLVNTCDLVTIVMIWYCFILVLLSQSICFNVIFLPNFDGTSVKSWWMWQHSRRLAGAPCASDACTPVCALGWWPQWSKGNQ